MSMNILGIRGDMQWPWGRPRPQSVHNVNRVVSGDCCPKLDPHAKLVWYVPSYHGQDWRPFSSDHLLEWQGLMSSPLQGLCFVIVVLVKPEQWHPALGPTAISGSDVGDRGGATQFILVWQCLWQTHRRTQNGHWILSPTAWHNKCLIPLFSTPYIYSVYISSTRRSLIFFTHLYACPLHNACNVNMAWNKRKIWLEH